MSGRGVLNFCDAILAYQIGRGLILGPIWMTSFMNDSMFKLRNLIFLNSKIRLDDIPCNNTQSCLGNFKPFFLSHFQHFFRRYFYSIFWFEIRIELWRLNLGGIIFYVNCLLDTLLLNLNLTGEKFWFESFVLSLHW